MSLHRTALSLALGPLLGLTLTACGQDDRGGDDAPAALSTARNGDVFNAADVAFATAMIPHHAQAVQMANLAADRPLPDDLRTLVDDVHATQVAEVETMVTWLTDWGQEIPETSMDHVNGGHGADGHDADGHGANGSDHGDAGEMPGMMSAAQMSALADATDAEFAERWMTMMIEHHEGAITMAENEQDDGHFPDAVELAETIVDTQRAEIATMEDLLAAS